MGVEAESQVRVLTGLDLEGHDVSHGGRGLSGTRITSVLIEGRLRGGSLMLPPHSRSSQSDRRQRLAATGLLAVFLGRRPQRLDRILRDASHWPEKPAWIPGLAGDGPEIGMGWRAWTGC